MMFKVSHGKTNIVGSCNYEWNKKSLTRGKNIHKYWPRRHFFASLFVSTVVMTFAYSFFLPLTSELTSVFGRRRLFIDASSSAGKPGDRNPLAVGLHTASGFERSVRAVSLSLVGSKIIYTPCHNVCCN
jgi:hypothetical protein